MQMHVDSSLVRPHIQPQVLGFISPPVQTRRQAWRSPVTRPRARYWCVGPGTKVPAAHLHSPASSCRPGRNADKDGAQGSPVPQYQGAAPQNTSLPPLPFSSKLLVGKDGQCVSKGTRSGDQGLHSFATRKLLSGPSKWTHFCAL